MIDNGDGLSMDYVKLSKQVSYALRHAPWKFGLELDNEGWVSVDDLLNSLHQRRQWRDLVEGDLQEMIRSSAKKRFEMAGGKIRALYGHSVSRQIVKKPAFPPRILYHGTARRFLSSIREKGLLPQGRQYVHLSVGFSEALQVGQRHDSKPVILRVFAQKAWDEGVKFYQGNAQVWLADAVPAVYIEFP